MKKIQLIPAALFAAMAIATSCDNSDTDISYIVSEREALIDLYESTDGDNWDNSGNWCTDAPLEDWYGVITDSEGNIKGLDLGNNDLEGSIPLTIGSLTNLEEINLGNNELKSSIPSTIGNLSNLKEMDLSNNTLSAEIPSEIGNLSDLEYLNLGNNQLEGSIPESIGNLSELKVLDLSYNSISGEIPQSLENLTSLTDLYLQETDLTGEIPQGLIDQGVNVVVDLELVIPSDLIGDMGNYMPIYEGVNPPNIEGCFLMDDQTVVYCEDGMWSAGFNNFYEHYFEFYDYDETDLTLKIKDQTEIIEGEGDGAYIRGEDNNFTAYFDIYVTLEGDSGNIISTRQATVISGTLTSTGITNMYYAFVLTSKENDMYGELMDEGVYRVFEEGDGIASKVTTTYSLTKSGNSGDEKKRSIYEGAKQ